jgi:subtilisin family serine protease
MLFSSSYFYRYGKKVFLKREKNNIVFHLSDKLKNLEQYSWENHSTVLLTHNIFVKIDQKMNNLNMFLRKNNLIFIKKFDFIPWILVSTTENAIDKSRYLIEHHIVKAAEPSFYFQMQLKDVLIPNDIYFSKQWSFFNNGKNNKLSGSDSSHIAAAWALLKKYIGNFGKNINLAIIDDGFDLNHEDLKNNFIEGYDFLEKDRVPNYGTYDFHGTCCAGIAGASFNNKKGIAGACPECKIMPIRLNLNATTLDSAVIETFEFAFKHNADIVNCSWGPADNLGPAQPGEPLQDLIEKMATKGRNSKGIIIVFASGNGNESISDSKTFDGYAANKYVFAIGATNASGKRASYSDFGKDLDFVVSSSDIDVSSGESFDNIWTTDNSVGGENSVDNDEKTENNGDNKGLYFSKFGGTSAAAPLASGIIALVLTANPNLSRTDIYDILKKSADKIGDENYDDNGFNIYYGYGRLNACKAVKEALLKKGIKVAKNACDENCEINLDDKNDKDDMKNDEKVDTDVFNYKNSGCGCMMVF